MYCSNCGKQVNENEKFCSECGKMLAEPEQSVQSETVEKSEVPVAKNNRGVIIGLCAVIAILAVCIVAVFASGFMLGIKDEKTVVSTIEALKEETTAEKETTTKKANTAVTNVTAKPTDSKGIVTPDYYTSEGYYYVKPKEGLFIRKGPGTNYGEITLLDRGVCVQYKGSRADSPGWYYVTVNSSAITGWVSAEYLTSTNPDSSMINKYYSYSKSFTGRVSEREGLNLRSGASTSSYIYDVIPKDRTVTVLGYSAYDSDWIYISVYLDGRTQYGFVKSEYVVY